MNSPFVGLAATACALFVVLLLVATYVTPYLNAVNDSLSAVLR